MLPTIRMNTAASAGDFARWAKAAIGTSSTAAPSNADFIVRIVSDSANLIVKTPVRAARACRCRLTRTAIHRDLDARRGSVSEFEAVGGQVLPDASHGHPATRVVADGHR